MISLDEMKNYLRIDFDDDDALLENLIVSSEQKETAKIAVMYAVAYQYEHREDCDHHALAMSLRSLLSGIRKAGF